MPQDITIIGAGIIGITTGLALQDKGFQVRILDRYGVAAGASQGNAGAFAFSELVPLATPGIMRKAPKWLLDPLGPLSIPPSYALKLSPWMIRFWRASWKNRFQAAITAQSRLMDLSSRALEPLITSVNGEHMIQRDGQLAVYEGQKEFCANLQNWERCKALGVNVDLLESRGAIAEIQPGLDARFTHAAYTPDWKNTVDPKAWTVHLAQVFLSRGGTIDLEDIRALAPHGSGVRLITNSGEIDTPQVIVAAGAWSHHLAKTLKDQLPLETERGYNTTLPEGAFDLKTHVTFSGHGFVVSRINNGVRVGGAVELGGLALPPNFKRADILLDKARAFLPGLNTEGGKQWMGFRPSMPDSLPVIDRSPKSDRVIYAFGHGHLGLTQSAGTAQLVTQLVTDTQPDIPLSPYSATRF
jgi:D-amino-acid dehydrogenase